MGSLSLLQEIFPAQGWNPGLLHCGQIVHHLTRQGSPLSLISNNLLMFRLPAKLLYNLDPPFASSEQFSWGTCDAASQAWSPKNSHRIKHNSQLLGCEYFLGWHVFPLRRNQHPALVAAPVSWLILFCFCVLYLPWLVIESALWYSGRSRRLKPLPCKQKTGDTKVFVPRRTSQGLAQFQMKFGGSGGEPEEDWGNDAP